MSKYDTDEFGVRMKNYEAYETQRTFLPGLPIYARLDGRGFSKFTKNMRRPYDVRMSELMVCLAKFLVEETNAKIGYTQSDEISLIYYTEDFDSEMFFNRKIMKLSSVLSGMASSFFAINLPNYFPDEWSALQTRVPHFDTRVIQFPSTTEATNMVLWRAMDAVKNAISMAAQSHFSHKSLHGLCSSKMQEKLFQEVGINFNDYPRFFKQGTFVRRVQVQRELPPEIMAKNPKLETNIVLRSLVKEIDMPVFNKVINRTAVIFEGAEPLTATIEPEKIFG